jgi:hypothetical protein
MNLLCLLLRQLLLELLLKSFFIIPFRGEVALHGSDECPGAQSETIEIIIDLFGCTSSTIIVGISKSDKVTSVVNVHTPVLTSFIPTLVRSIGAENCDIKKNVR